MYDEDALLFPIIFFLVGTPIVIAMTTSAMQRGPYTMCILGLLGAQFVLYFFGGAAGFVAVLLLAALAMIEVRLVARRYNDIGRSKWWALLLVLPLVSLVVMISLCFYRSAKAPAVELAAFD